MRYAASSPTRIVREQEEHARVVREEEAQALRQKKARTARRAAPESGAALTLSTVGRSLGGARNSRRLLSSRF